MRPQVAPVHSKVSSFKSETSPLITFAGSHHVIHLSSSGTSACVWNLDEQQTTEAAGEIMEGPSGHKLHGFSSDQRGAFVASLFVRNSSRRSRNCLSIVKLWGLETLTSAQEISTSPGYEDMATSICLLEDGRALLGTFKGRITIWDLDHGQEAVGAVAAADESRTVYFHSHSGMVHVIKSATSSPSMVLSASHDDTFRLWDLRAGSCVRIMKAGESVQCAFR